MLPEEIAYWVCTGQRFSASYYSAAIYLREGDPSVSSALPFRTESGYHVFSILLLLDLYFWYYVVLLGLRWVKARRKQGNAHLSVVLKLSLLCNIWKPQQKLESPPHSRGKRPEQPTLQYLFLSSPAWRTICNFFEAWSHKGAQTSTEDDDDNNWA